MNVAPPGGGIATIIADAGHRSEGSTPPNARERAAIRDSYESHATASRTRTTRIEIGIPTNQHRAITIDGRDADADRWRGTIDVSYSATPRVVCTATSDMTKLMDAFGTTPPRWIAWALRGPVSVDTRVDASPIHTSCEGTVIELDSRFGNYLIQATTRFDPNAVDADLSTTIRVRGRRSGRIALFVLSPLIRRGLRELTDDLHSDESVANFRAGVDQLRDDVREAGDAKTYVHELLWNELA